MASSAFTWSSSTMITTSFGFTRRKSWKSWKACLPGWPRARSTHGTGRPSGPLRARPRRRARRPADGRPLLGGQLGVGQLLLGLGEECGPDHVLELGAVVEVEQEGTDAAIELCVQPAGLPGEQPALSALADIALWAPAKATSSTRRSHSSTYPLHPASLMLRRSRPGARTARTNDIPPRSSTSENVATPVVPPRASLRGVTREDPRRAAGHPRRRPDEVEHPHRADDDEGRRPHPHHELGDGQRPDHPDQAEPDGHRGRGGFTPGRPSMARAEALSSASRSGSGPRPASVAARAITAPRTIRIFPVTLSTCTALQNTARRAVRWRGSCPTSAATFSSAARTAKITAPTATRQTPTTSNVRPAVRRPADDGDEAGHRGGGEGEDQPAGEIGPPHEQVRPPALGHLHPHVQRAVRDGLGHSRVHHRQGVLDELAGVIDLHPQPGPVAPDYRSVHLPDSGMEQALEGLGGHHLGHHLAQQRAHRRHGLRGGHLVLEVVDDLVGHRLGDRRLLQGVGGDVGEALRVGEGPPAPQRHRGQEGEDGPRDEERDAGAAEVVASAWRARGPIRRPGADRAIRHARTVPPVGQLLLG